MNEITLAGCTPTPLANYLKALGIFRLVAEQKDPGVKAFWRGEQFVLVTRLSPEELTRFFLDEYRPTPILSPWNGRAGYLEGDDSEESTQPAVTDSDTIQDEELAVNTTEEAKRRGGELLEAFRKSTAIRFSAYRDLIFTLDGMNAVRERDEIRSKKKLLDKEKKIDNRATWSDEKQSLLADATKREAFLKAQILNLLRNALPDAHIIWLDAVVAVGLDKAFAPLLGGTGGVEGSMDIGVNFMDNLVFLITPDAEAGPPTAYSATWLAHALSGSPAPLTAKNTAGSLAPGRVGGPNATSGFLRKLNISPWDFILMIEGAVTFKPSMTRKLGSTGKARMSYPFTVEPSSIGAGSLSSDDQKRTRAGASELWMPLWSAGANYVEIVTLLREGSARLGAKVPKDGLDMARCIAKLGIDRGMTGFQRFLFLKRSGDNDLAVPLNRFDLTSTSAHYVDLINDLEQDNFLELLRSKSHEKDCPTALKSAIAHLANALFALTRPGTERRHIEQTLILFGEVMQAVGVSRNSQNRLRVLPRLSQHWIFAAYEDSAEFRVALALASLPHMTAHVAPVDWHNSLRSWKWQPESRLHVWGRGELTRNLMRIAERRIIESKRKDHTGEPFHSLATLGARQADIQAFLSEKTDDGRIAALLQSLVWVDMPNSLPYYSVESEIVADKGLTPIPIAYRVLKPFFAPLSLLRYLNRLPKESRWVVPDEIPRLLSAGRVNDALVIAWRRSRVCGLGWPIGGCPNTPKINAHRLLAALTIPIQPTDLSRLLPPVEDQEPEPAQA